MKCFAFWINIFFVPLLSMQAPDKKQIDEKCEIIRMQPELERLKKKPARALWEFCTKKLEYAAEHDFLVLADQMLSRLEESLLPFPFTQKDPNRLFRKAFFIAIQKGNIPLVKLFLKKRKDIYKECMEINDENPTYVCALDIAAQYGNLELAQVLVQAGNNPNHSPRAGRDTPLNMAIRDYNMPAIRTLLLVGADPDFFIEYKCGKEHRKEDFNALMEATIHRKGYEAFELLLKGVEYPPNLFVNLMLVLKKRKKKTYFYLLPNDLFSSCASYLAPHFKIQADPTVKSASGRTISDLLNMHAFLAGRKKPDDMIALLQSKIDTKIEKSKITPMELYNLSTK